MLVTTYYYFLLIGLLALVGVLLARRLARTCDLGPRDLRAVVEVLFWSTILSIWYWGPLLWTAVERGTWDPLQNRFYGLGSVPAPLPFLTFDLVGFVLLFGLVFLATQVLRSSVARGLALLLSAAYLWWAINYVAVVIGVPLLSDKVTFLIEWILAVAAALGTVELGGWIRKRAGDLWAASVVGTFVVVFALGQTARGNIPFVEEQRAERYPTQLLVDYQREVGRDRRVVLTDVIVLNLYLPNVYLFNVWNANYANPVSAFSERAALIRKLSRERDPEVFALVLVQNRYDRITEIVFRLGSRSYAFDDDNFPNGTRHRTVDFQPEAFGGLFFTQLLTDDLEILVPRVDPRDISCDALRAAALRYGHHLRNAARTRARNC